MWNTVFRMLTQLTARPSLSRLSGTIARSAWSHRLIPLFIRTYRIDAQEAAFPLSAYDSLHAFFTRTLRPGARPISADPLAVISPVDGIVSACGRITEDATFVVKGQHYTVAQLLNDSTEASAYADGGYVVIYLSPAHYHRIHAPLSAPVRHFRTIQGAVYPVHQWSMRHMPRVLAQNTRTITSFEGAAGASFALVKVGALNVAAIPYTQHGHHPPAYVTKGEDLAYFTFGSTVVWLWSAEAMQPTVACTPGHAVRMGECIGVLSAPHH